MEQLKQMQPDAMVVVGYGQIIPQSIIDIPRYGIINVHASLLPKYRGAAPIQWAIANGEPTTGVTTMRIDAGLDTGDMLLKWETPIGPEENAIELGQRMAQAGADLLVETLAGIERRKHSSGAAGQRASVTRAHPQERRRRGGLELAGAGKFQAVRAAFCRGRAPTVTFAASSSTSGKPAWPKSPAKAPPGRLMPLKKTAPGLERRSAAPWSCSKFRLKAANECRSRRF